jgi:AcrR family transcriptional regulator
MKSAKPASAIGRPREFDLDEALNRAMQVFWQKGYEGASLTELTEAMGINRPSLYAAFGNKESLFKKALDRYGEGPACHVHKALQEPTARAVADYFLRGSVDLLTNPQTPHGCLAVQSALACGKEAEPVKQELNRRRTEVECAIRKRLERAKEEADLPASADPADLARYLCVVSNGMSVQASAGATREELLKTVAMALLAWPA